jgi:hypothetical protein
MITFAHWKIIEGIIKMSKSKKKFIPLFYYLGLLQLLVACCSGIFCLIFIYFPSSHWFNFVLGFLPDNTLTNYFIIALMMLFMQVIGNLIGFWLSFTRSDSTSYMAMSLGGAEMLWMVFQYIMLHMRSIVMLMFFMLGLALLIFGYILYERIIELKKED